VVKKIIVIIFLLILSIIFGGCATKRKAKNYSELRGLMLLENTQLGRNKHYNSAKYQKTLKKNYKKFKKNN
jgi:hypothetical protein